MDYRLQVRNCRYRFLYVIIASCLPARLLLTILLAGGLPTAYCFAQSTQELEQKLQSATADEKPGILNQIAEGYLKSDPNKSIEYAEQALKAARKLDDAEGEAGALINLGEANDAIKNNKKAIQYYKDAIKLYDQFDLPANSAYLWNKIADSYISSDKYDDAIDANGKALNLYKKANDKTGVLNMNIELGDIYFKQKKYESALPLYKQALKMYEDTRDAKGQVTILNRIGTTYSQWGNYDESHMFLTRALEMAKKNNLTSLINSISKNLEVVTNNLSNYEKSKTEFDKIKDEKITDQLKTNENVINALASKNIKSMAEIDQLSEEAQLKELKIKAQQEENNRVLMEAEAQAKANELLKKEKELTDSELKTQRLIIWGGVGFSVLGLLLTILVFGAYRNKKKANDILKQKNDIIYKQKEQIEQKNILITDSIDYAKNIQDAILPPVSILEKHFSKSFVLNKPKDIVSGDFYWIHESNENDSISIAAADCTGHGVPGAFMSLLGFIMLDDIARRNVTVSPADLLKEVNTQLMSMLHQNTENTTGKFGMDIALIKYDKLKKEIRYSGAHNPLILISDGEIKEIKADKIAIGTSPNCSFTNNNVSVKAGDTIYLYSDGYQDQIGGEKRKKFLSYNLKELLKEIHTLEPAKQQEELDKKHLEWRGKIEQIDDILIIGLQV